MRPRRLAAFDYSGCHRYFITCCCWRRERSFRDVTAVGLVAPLFISSLAERDFACLAYVFMPDHVHLLIEGIADTAALRPAMKFARQRTGVSYRRERGTQLWQEGYYERVLRNEESTQHVIAYILNNPVRAGLVAEWGQFEFSWAVEFRDVPRPQL